MTEALLVLLALGRLSVEPIQLRQELLTAFEGVLPETVRVNVWINETQGTDPRGLTSRGAVGLGNGKLFCLEGFGLPLNSLHGMVGPTYQKRGGYFCDLSTYLNQSEERIRFQRQWCGRLRGTGVAFTKAQFRDLVLWTLDFIPLGEIPSWSETCLIRLVCVENRSKNALQDLSLSTAFASSVGLVQEGDRILEKKGSRRRSLQARGTSFQMAPAQLKIPLNSLPGKSSERTLFLLQVYDANRDETPAKVPLMDFAEVRPLLQETIESWRSPPMLRWHMAENRVSDLMDSLTHCLRVQQSSAGAISPMSLYTSTWLRDTVGPVMGMLSMGLFQEAREMILYQIRAIKTDRSIRNSRDCDVHYAEGSETKPWRLENFMPGRVPAEAPSYLPLMVYRYVRSTGDLSLLEDALPVLVTCLERQRVDQGRLPFSGDETFRVAMASHFGLPLEFPFEKEAWSSNSAFLYVSAVEAMQELCALLNREDVLNGLPERAAQVREVTDGLFWSEKGSYYIPYILKDGTKAGGPYIDVNGKALWCGYLDIHDEKARSNIEACIARLQSAPGLLHGKIHPRFSLLGGLLHASSIHTGMTYGYTLSSLSQLDHPQAEMAFCGLLDHALGTGVFAEYMIDPGPNALTLGYDVTGQLMDYTGRYRPWEGGINLAACVEYLLGFQPNAPQHSAGFAPHLPSDWQEFSFYGLRMGSSFFSGRITGTPASRTLDLQQEGPQSLRVSVRLSMPAHREILWEVDGRTVPVEKMWRRHGITSGIIRDLPLVPGERLVVSMRTGGNIP